MYWLTSKLNSTDRKEESHPEILKSDSLNVPNSANCLLRHQENRQKTILDRNGAIRKKQCFLWGPHVWHKITRWTFLCKTLLKNWNNNLISQKSGGAKAPPAPPSPRCLNLQIRSESSALARWRYISSVVRTKATTFSRSLRRNAMNVLRVATLGFLLYWVQQLKKQL